MPPKKNKDKVAFYAVKYGLVPGIYTTWEECKIQINGYYCFFDVASIFGIVVVFRHG